VTAVNGKGIEDATTLINETAMLSPGTRAELRVLRGREAMTLALELGQRPAPGNGRGR
jgi:S1-C subfamily serine protease